MGITRLRTSASQSIPWKQTINDFLADSGEARAGTLKGEALDEAGTN